MAYEGTPSGSGWQSGVDALRQGRVEDAIAQLSAFVQANPNSFEGNNFLGVALAQAGRHQEAVSYLQQATRLNPQSAQAHYNLGLACMSAQQNDAARTAFQTALQIDPNYAPAQQALARLPAPVAETPTWTAPPSAASQTPTWTASSPAEPMTPTTPLSRLPASPPLFAETPTAVRKPARATDTATLSVEDILKAFAFGAIAAVIGAVVWDKLVYYTHIQFGLVAVGVGFVVGLGVAMGAGGKTSVALQAMGALLALAGMLLGEGLIIKDVHQVDLMTGIINIPSLLAADPLTLLFIAIGVYEGWKIPGRGKTAG